MPLKNKYKLPKNDVEIKDCGRMLRFDVKGIGMKYDATGNNVEEGERLHKVEIEEKAKDKANRERARIIKEFFAKVRCVDEKCRWLRLERKEQRERL